MYQYGKTRNRVSVSPKEIFGPQFGIQNAAGSSGERPMKQMMVSGRDVNVMRGSNVLTNHNVSRSGSGSADQLTNQQVHVADKLGQYSRNASYSKRTVPTATALVHDLSNDLGSGGGEDDSMRQVHSASMSSRNQKAPTFLPGDRVTFVENPASPGTPTVYRVPEERAANPDRLNLDRRRLTVCPILEGEDQLRLLNYQHNLLTRITHLTTLRRLIFLDLYDNQIEEISGLNVLKSLRVLMLGKNKIRRIENLNYLLKLDVLDLHGNQISVIENLNHLTELRVLNLAGNQLTHVTNLLGMDALAELNLRRNHIRTVVDVDNLLSLQRLFLSFNEITSFDDICCLADSHSLSEVSLDGNPFSQDAHYKQIVLRHMTQLRQFDMKRISEDERRIATVMARKEEEKKRECNKIAVMKEKRRLAINNAKRQWEVMQGSMMQRTNKLVRMPELFANHIGSYTTDQLEVDQSEDKDIFDYSDQLNTYIRSRPTSAKSVVSEGGHDVVSFDASKHQGSRSSSRASLAQSPDKDRIHSGFGGVGSDMNVCHLAELEAETLNLYGAGSVDALDKNWGVQAAGSVTTIKFKFIDFDEISPHFHKIRARFPNVQTLHFSATNIHSLQQLNALSSVRRLDNLFIEPDGNPIIQFSLWKTYALFRLAHFSIRKINEVEVTASDIVNAEKFFGTLAHMTTSQLPQSRLLSILGETRKKQLLALSDEKSRKADTKMSEKGNSESVGRAGLVYHPAEVLQSKMKDKNNRLEFTRSYTRELAMEAAMIEHKKSALQKLFPQLLREMTQNAVLDMCDTEAYMKLCMQELEAS